MRGRTEEMISIVTIYNGIELTGLNFMLHKHISGSQIENNMLENRADQREMALLFSLLFSR